MNQFERFLKGEPLTPELAELAAQGVIREPDAAAEDDPAEPLSRADRNELRRWSQQPGWGIAMRLLDLSLENTRQSAINLSEHDPTNPGVNDAWVFIKAFKAVRQEFVNIIETAARGQNDETGMGEQRPTA